MRTITTYLTTSVEEVIINIDGKKFAVFVGHVLANGRVLDTIQGMCYEVVSTNIGYRKDKWLLKIRNTNKALMERESA